MPSSRGQAANEAIPGVILSLVGMRDKVMAVRAQIAPQVFWRTARSFRPETMGG